MHPRFFIGDQVLVTLEEPKQNETAYITGMKLDRDAKGLVIGWVYDVELANKPTKLEGVIDDRLTAVMAFQRSYYRKL